MKTIIAGSRNAQQKDVEAIMKTYGWMVSEVISGGARGADTFGEQWAQRHKIPVKKFPADWSKHGKAAGPIRNKQMAEYADALILVWDGKSRGSLNMLEQATRHGLKVYIYQFGESA